VSAIHSDKLLTDPAAQTHGILRKTYRRVISEKKRAFIFELTCKKQDFLSHVNIVNIVNILNVALNTLKNHLGTYL